MKEENAICVKSKMFALRIVRLYKHLSEKKHETILSRQVLRSGTSIGANVREAQRAQTKKDFITKMNISLKEADETAYWLELLIGGEFITEKQYQSIYPDCEELIKLLTKIIKTSRLDIE